MASSFRRAYRLDVGSRRFEGGRGDVGLKIEFDVERDKTRFPNKCTVKLTNLARTTIHELQTRAPLPVRLEVGYAPNREPELSQVFFGELRRVTAVVQGTDTVTTLFAGDATDPLSASRISRTFPKGTTLVDVLRALVDALGLGRGNLAAIEGILLGRTLGSALTLDGSAAEELESFTRSFGLAWSVQDGAFTIDKIGAEIPGTRGILVNPAHGLIESPSIDPKTKHVSGKCFIQPGFLPGCAFEVESEFVRGKFLCKKTKHTGDWTGRPWYVEFEGSPL